MRKFITLLLLILLSLISFSQESQVKINYEGKDFYQLKHAWKAQWITHPTASTLDYGVFNFRKSFVLESIPQEFIVYVSADNRYRLFVNGQYITYGPSLGDINNYRYETIDISKYLQKGNNVIAAEVINFGEYRRAAQQTFQTAFILQSEYKKEDINTGTSDWKVNKNEAYICIPFTSDSLKSYYAAGPGENIFAEKYPWGWKEIDYDDSLWLNPKPGTVEFAVGRGFLYGSTWYLIPRQIPFMRETKEHFNKIARTANINSIEVFIEDGKSATIPVNTKTIILLDNKLHTTGFPELIVSGGKNSSIKITYAEALLLPDNNDANATGAHFGSFDLKGNRDVVEGKHILGYYDIINPDGGNNRLFKPLSRKTFRYVQLDIETGNEPLIIEDFYNVFTGYPFEQKAEFKTDDEQLTQIFDAAWRTIENSSEEIFFDPYYEQLQYIGDTRIEALVSIYVSGDDKLMRKAITQFDDSRLPNGLTQSRYPSYINQVIPTYSLLWIAMINDYFMYRNDEAFVEQFVPGMKSVLDWFAKRVDKTGMVTNLEWWNFTDWSKGFANGIPPGADNGYSANVNLQYVYALQNANAIFKYFGYSQELEKYKAIENRVKSSVLKNCYSKVKNMIAETSEKKLFSQHSNIWAILTNTVEEKEQKDLMHNIISDTSLIQSTMYFKFYLFRALQKTELGNNYLNMLQPWKNMLDKGMTTFGETDEIPRSECHGWSASPAFDFLHTVAGIYPKEAGFKSVIIAPNFGYLKEINVKFPHPEGEIKVNLTKKKNIVEGKIIVPKGITGEFIWNSKNYNLNKVENIIRITN